MHTMKPSKQDDVLASQTASDKSGAQTEPDWADGLKRLYDSVLDEPLPPSFEELLAKLDETGSK